MNATLRSLGVKLSKISHQKNFKVWFFLGIVMFLLIAIFIVNFFLANKNNNNQIIFDDKITPTDIISSPSVSISTTLTPINNSSINPTKVTTVPTVKVTIKPTATVIPTVRTANPPQINISYPSEMQSVEFTSTSQKLCVVDSPAGGDSSSLQIKYNINDTGWTTYVNHFTLCFNPKEGLNRFQVQYRNGFGDESTVYTRQFNFHLISDITVSINGQLYMDQNCNKTKEPGVSGINVTMYKGTDGYSTSAAQTTVSDSNGNYTVSDKIKSNESINFRATAYSHTFFEYTRTSFVSLNSSTTSTTQDIGMTQSEGGCQ